MPKKGEKLSPEQAEKLKKAREKALATRRKNAEIRKKEKLVKDLEKQKKSKDLDKTIENIKMETDEHGDEERHSNFHVRKTISVSFTLCSNCRH